MASGRGRNRLPYLLIASENARHTHVLVEGDVDDEVDTDRLRDLHGLFMARVSLEEVGTLKKKLKILQKGLQGERGIGMIYDLPKWAYIQALLSRGDRRVGRMLVAAHGLEDNWSRALRESSINPDFFVYRRRNLDEVFPWDFIDHGIPKERLKQEYLKAMEEAGIAV